MTWYVVKCGPLYYEYARDDVGAVFVSNRLHARRMCADGAAMVAADCDALYGLPEARVVRLVKKEAKS